MRKYEFSLGKESRRLPPISKWIDPKYEGEISTFDYELGKEVNFPKNWRTDFPIYDYKISELEKIDYWSYEGESFTRDIVQKFNTEQINERWIDFYEIYTSTLDDILIKTSKRRNRLKAYRSFHINNVESIYALNHLIKTKHPGVFWEWNATADRIMTQKPYLESGLSRDLYDRYPTAWFFGTEGDGDMQSPDNIRSITNVIEPVQLFTAPLSLGAIVCMAQILSRDGNAIFYVDQINTSFQFSMVYMLGCCFETSSIVRPNSNSSELYYVGKGFRGISSLHITRLENILKYSKHLEIPPAIFPKDKIASEFIIEFCGALAKATMQREKKDLTWWINTTGIQPIRDPAKLLH